MFALSPSSSSCDAIVSFSFSEMLDQSLAPHCSISVFSILSSCLDHFVLLPPSFWMKSQRLWHFLGSFVGTISAIYSQSLSSKSSTNFWFLTMKAKSPYWKRCVSSSFHYVCVLWLWAGSFFSFRSLSKISMAYSSDMMRLP